MQAKLILRAEKLEKHGMQEHTLGGQMQIREKLRNKRMYRFSEAEYRVAIREEREAKL